jgi:hypothetical protein
VPWSGFRQRNQAPVAQLDRAPDYESGGQEFESLRARHQLVDFDSEFLRDFRPVTFYFCGSTGATRAKGSDVVSVWPFAPKGMLWA